MQKFVLVMFFIFLPLCAMKSSDQMQMYAVSSGAQDIDYDEEISFIRSITHGTLHITEDKRAQFPKYNNSWLCYDRPYKESYKVLIRRFKQIARMGLYDEGFSECKHCCHLPYELMQDLTVLLEKKKTVLAQLKKDCQDSELLKK